jgi:dUTP pyrophosphatase
VKNGAEPEPGPVVKYRWRPGCEDLLPPVYATQGAAGADLRAAVEEPLTLPSLERTVIPTGLFLEIPVGFEGQVRARSGLALKAGLSLVNGVGTIDSDYRGEVGVIVVNLGSKPLTVERGDRIAQLVIARVERAVFSEGSDLAGSQRGSGGFGSTGSE